MTKCQSVRAPPGGTAHVRSQTAPHVALSSDRHMCRSAGRTCAPPAGPHAALLTMPPAAPLTMPHAAWALRDFRRFVLALQALAAALHGGDELRQVDLQRAENLIRVVLSTKPDLALACPGILDDVLGGALGLLGDLLLAHELLLALARLLDDALGLLLGLGEHLLALLDDPARLLDLLGDRRAHLVEDVVDLLLVDPYLVGHGHRLGVVHQVVELVDQHQHVHQRSPPWSIRYGPTT